MNFLKIVKKLCHFQDMNLKNSKAWKQERKNIYQTNTILDSNTKEQAIF